MVQPIEYTGTEGTIAEDLGEISVDEDREEQSTSHWLRRRPLPVGGQGTGRFRGEVESQSQEKSADNEDGPLRSAERLLWWLMPAL